MSENFSFLLVGWFVQMYGSTSKNKEGGIIMINNSKKVYGIRLKTLPKNVQGGSRYED